MSAILRRLKKLESQMTDRCGYVPHSETWFQYWAEGPSGTTNSWRATEKPSMA